LKREIKLAAVAGLANAAPTHDTLSQPQPQTPRSAT